MRLFRLLKLRPNLLLKCPIMTVCRWVHWFSRCDRCWAVHMRCLVIPRRPAGRPPRVRVGGWPGAGDVVRSGQSQISVLSGQFAAGYGRFAAGAGLALDDLAGADERLSTRLRFDSVALQQIWF
jgi:hypothetical protein